MASSAVANSGKLLVNPKLLVFDQFQTLTESIVSGGSDPERDLIQEFGLKMAYPDVEKVVCGTAWTSDAQYLDAVIAGLELKGVTRDQVRKVFENDASKERITKEAVDVVNTLHMRGYQLALLSNAATPQYAHVCKPGSGLEGAFHPAIYSFAVGMVKPDPKIFELLLKEAGVAAEEAIMIGDSLRSDVKGALDAGLRQAILLDRADAHPEILPRIKSLTELLDLLPCGPTIHLKVSMKKSVGFYIRLARSFLQGLAERTLEDGTTTKVKPSAEELKISGIGEAINTAVQVANCLQVEGHGTIAKVETSYPGVAGGRNAARIMILVKRH